MLILTRKPGESIFIGNDIKVVLVEMKGNQVRIGIEAPSHVRILREEIHSQVVEENQSAAQSVSGDSLEGLSAVLVGPAGTSSVLKPVLSPATKRHPGTNRQPASHARPKAAAEEHVPVSTDQTSSTHGGKK